MTTGFLSPINDFDDTHSIVSSPNGSFIDFSQSASRFLLNTRSSHTRSGTIGSEDSATSIYAQPRSTIRINTNMMSPRQSPRDRPLPPTPEPNWTRTTYLGPLHPHPYSASFSTSATPVDSSPRGVGGSRALLEVEGRPPTTNHLRPQERADLVRKSRKLTQLLGETPSPQSVSPHRTSERLSDEAPLSWAGLPRPRPSWAFRPGAQSVDSLDHFRRHSTPSSPVEAMWDTELSLAGAGGGFGRGRGKTKDKSARATEMRDSASFIDLSDDDNASSMLRRVLTQHTIPSRGPSRLSDPTESTSLPRSQEEDRRRRREKLAKLHRFLGSRVPTSLVLGINEDGDALPALDPSLGNIRARLPGRRRSSSAAEFKSNWFDEGDRVKEELNEREKAINVRRAVKMEKMFGVQPPQTLYHTRHSSNRAQSTERSSPPEREASVSAGRNVNQSPYLIKGSKQSKHRRDLSQSESIRPLLDSEEAGSSSGKRGSVIYMHYRSSLDSLSRIIDRDDMESLAELHSILTNGTNGQLGTEACTTPMGDDDAKTVRSGRRFSLPAARSSSLSLASQFSLNSPSPEMASFQARRRQAAKLTHFFGVDYRELIGDIIESIERDVQEECHRGSLCPEEIQDLMVKLRSLKTKRIGVI